MSGLPLAIGTLSPGGVRLARKSKSETKKDDADQDGPKEFEAHYDSSTYNKSVKLTSAETPVVMEGTLVSPSSATFSVDKLVLPAEKGPFATEHCSKPYRPLKAAFQWTDKPQPVGNERRDDTDTLRKKWLSKYGYKPGKEADQRWQDVGGVKPFPKIATGPTCEIDHIQELQVGGDNEKENLQVLDKVDNSASGNLIQQQLRYLATAAFNDAQEQLQQQGLKKKRPKKIELQFSGVVMPGTPKCNLGCQLAKRFADPSVTADTAKTSGPVILDYDLIILGNPLKLKIPADKTKSVPLAGSTFAENKAAAQSIKGLTLISFERGGKGKDKIRASIDGDKFLLKPGAKGGDLLLPIASDGTLQLPTGKAGSPLHFEYTKLSQGVFNKLTVDGSGVTAEGSIKPSVPFLPALDVALSPDSFRIVKGIDKERLKAPFPGFRFTKAELALELAPAFKPVGTLAFAMGPAAKPLAAGEVKASADEAGLVLDGKLFVYLPGVDNASGDIKYQACQWSGGAHIESSQIKLPYIKSGAVDVYLRSGKVDAGGKVLLDLPGGNEASLELKYTQNKWLFTGQGKIKVKSPYLKPIQAWIAYDGELFVAKGQAGFAFAGLDGTVDATYENKSGQEKIYGKGDIKIDKGRAKGNIVIELHPNQKITGKGRLSYEIKKDLVASAGITVDEQQKITFDGELAFPDITLFNRFPEAEQKRTIFEASGSIPIPGASIGPIGLKVKLWGGLYYYYYVGPGILRGVKANVKFSPFEQDPDFSFTLHASAVIPTGGGITGKVGADVVIDVYIAEVGGGLNVSATAGLEGKAELSSDIAYSKDKFSVDASAYIGGRVILEAGLNARVYAEAGVWKFKVRTEKTWELAKASFNTGLQLGVRLPLHYDSIEGFRMPSLSDIKPEPEKLDINPSSMLSSLFSSARSEERET